MAGLAVTLEAFARFAWDGLGTPGPVAPTRTLVVRGLYRFVRNPMYVAVTALIFGQAILFEGGRSMGTTLLSRPRRTGRPTLVR